MGQHPEGAEHDLDIAPQAPRIYVFHICLQPIRQVSFGVRGAAQAADLGKAGDCLSKLEDC